MQTTTHGKLARALGIAVLSCALALCAYAAALCADTTLGAQGSLAETAYASIYTDNTSVGNKTFVFNKKNGTIGGLLVKHKGKDKIVSAKSSNEKIVTTTMWKGNASIFLGVNHVGTAKVRFKTKRGKHYTLTIKTTKKWQLAYRKSCIMVELEPGSKSMYLYTPAQNVTATVKIGGKTYTTKLENDSDTSSSCYLNLGKKFKKGTKYTVTFKAKGFTHTVTGKVEYMEMPAY